MSLRISISAESEDSRRTSDTVLAAAPCPSGHPGHCVVPGNSDGPNAARKLKENSSQDIRLPKQFDLPLTVMSSTEDDGRRARPEGQRTTSCKRSGLTGSCGQAPSPKEGPSAAALPRKSADSRPNSPGKMRANGERRDPETDMDADAEAPILWPPDVNRWPHWKSFGCWKILRAVG